MFQEQCVGCHSGSAAPLGLQLDTYENALKGSVNGPVLVSGKPDDSELVRRVRGESQPQMPLGSDPLPPEQIAAIEAWVSQGMPEGGEATLAAEPQPAPPAAEQPASAAGQQPPPAGGEQPPSSNGDPAGAVPGQQAAAPSRPAGAPVTFADVQPIFATRCTQCHSAAAGNPPEGLSLDTYETIIRGGEHVVVVPGNADDSELVRRIEGRSQPRMPLGQEPLPPDQIELIRQWISAGATDAQGNPAPILPGGADGSDDKRDDGDDHRDDEDHDKDEDDRGKDDKDKREDRSGSNSGPG
jgi:mono/diheme cytochrome c family protein